MGRPLLVFLGLWFDIYLWLPLRKAQNCVMEEKKFKNLEDLLVLWTLYCNS
jgi:hypothetical protein